MTLLKGDETNREKVKQVELVIRKRNDEEKFNEIILGEQEQLLKYYNQIKEFIDEGLLHIYNSAK